MKNLNGPWKKGTGITGAVVDASGNYVCTVFGVTMEEVHQREAVIAVAPESLEAVRKLVKLVDSLLPQMAKFSVDIGLLNDSLMAGRSAIEKANGGVA